MFNILALCSYGFHCDLANRVDKNDCADPDTEDDDSYSEVAKGDKYDTLGVSKEVNSGGLHRHNYDIKKGDP